LPLILLNQQKLLLVLIIFLISDTNYGPTTAIRPRLVNGAIDYTAAPTTVDFTNSNLLILETSLNLDKTEDLFLLD
jgi:hypothetical protein